VYLYLTTRLAASLTVYAKQSTGTTGSRIEFYVIMCFFSVLLLSLVLCRAIISIHNSNAHGLVLGIRGLVSGREQAGRIHAITRYE
jgi:hypothetical protein